MAANMKHCRFTNTLEALKEAYEHIDDQASPAEEVAKTKLVKLCEEIAVICGNG